MPRRRAIAPLFACLLAGGAALSACTSAELAREASSLPVIGLPDGTPARPAVAPDYPAVHDMPPDRKAQTLSEDQREKMERDLVSARDRADGGRASREEATAKKKPKAAKPAAETAR